MPQLNLVYNVNYGPNVGFGMENGSLSFVPFVIEDSISFRTLNLICNDNGAAASATYTFSIGLYSLTGSSLSLANSVSGAFSMTVNDKKYISFTATSATQNITPGTWWFGLLLSTGGNTDYNLLGLFGQNPGNAFPGSFIGGRMTDSTNALPSSYATSNLDITGSDAVKVPFILLSS